jgi:hypothetical protein
VRVIAIASILDILGIKSAKTRLFWRNEPKSIGWGDQKDCRMSALRGRADIT